MPFANFWAARQADPSDFKAHRYVKNAGGSGVDFVYGIRAKAGPEGGHSQLQAVRFSKEKFDKEAAAAWLKKHNLKTTVEAVTMNSMARLKEVLEASALIPEPPMDVLITKDKKAKEQYKFGDLCKVTDGKVTKTYKVTRVDDDGVYGVMLSREMEQPDHENDDAFDTVGDE